jgi:hypothetical protein
MTVNRFVGSLTGSEKKLLRFLNKRYLQQDLGLHGLTICIIKYIDANDDCTR